jgi:hypothetical protein
MNTEPEPNPHVALNNAREEGHQGYTGLPPGVIARPTGTEALAWQLYADMLEKYRRLSESKRKSGAGLAKVITTLLVAGTLVFTSVACRNGGFSYPYYAGIPEVHATPLPAPQPTPSAHVELPNACAIVAAQALYRVKDCSVWSRVVWLRFVDFKDTTVHGHALVVWQAFEKGTMYAYDSSGTFELQTKSHTIGDIVFELNSKMNSRFYIYEAHYAE